MKSKNTQRGSIELILVAIFTIIVLGGIGYIACNKLSEKPQEHTTPSTTSITRKPIDKDELKNIAFDKTFQTGTAIKYPNTWKYEHTFDAYDDQGRAINSQTPLEDTQSDTTKIISPSGDVIVLLSVFKNGGIGGTCDNSQQKLLFIKREEIKQYPNVNYLEYIVQKGLTPGEPSHNFYSMGAAKTESNIDTVTLESKNSCFLINSNLLGVTSMPNEPVTSVTMYFKSISDLGYSSTLDQIKAKLTGEEYETGKKIIKSLHKKND